MAVLVQDDGVLVTEYEIKLGNSISFRVGGTIAAFMERVGPAPDSDMFMDAAGGNAEPVTVEYESRPSWSSEAGSRSRPTPQTKRRGIPSLEDHSTELGVKEKHSG